MFAVVRRSFWNRRRAIFRFWDGRRFRSIDPMTAYRSLVENTEFNWESHPPLIDLGDIDALKITADATRQAFSVPAFDAGGLTEAELVELLTSFVCYLNTLKKSINPSLISPAPTEPESSDASTTKPASDSGSISIEPKPDELPAC